MRTASADALLRNPTVAVVDSCARAARDHVVAPAISRMNLRRLIFGPNGCCAKLARCNPGSCDMMSACGGWHFISKYDPHRKREA
jgi:hypothetical protein